MFSLCYRNYIDFVCYALVDGLAMWSNLLRLLNTVHFGMVPERMPIISSH